MFSKVKVVGEGQSPVFRFLSADYGEPKWNFYKYLVNRDGKVVKAFPNSVKPEDPGLRAAVEEALK
jgi:glutathione peroxidase